MIGAKRTISKVKTQASYSDSEPLIQCVPATYKFLSLTMLSSVVLSEECEQQSMKYFWGSEHHPLYTLEIKEQTQPVNAIKPQFHFPTFY
jgi:hypothetical protein